MQPSRTHYNRHYYQRHREKLLARARARYRSLAIERFNHEIWHTCSRCAEVFDLRLFLKCPSCGAHYKAENHVHKN